MASFIFGGDTNETPESIKRKRDIARALLQASAPRNVGEGISALGDGIVSAVMNSRADKAEKTGMASADSAWASILGGATSQPTAGATGGAMPSLTPSGEVPVSGGSNNYRDAIASIESAGSGDYAAVGPTHPKMGRALGRYQIMEANIGPWSKAALGREVTPDEFMSNPELQDAIFDKQFGGYVEKFGPEGAAQAWFAGPGGVGKTNRKDVLGTDVGSYGKKFVAALGQGGQPNAGAQAIEAIAPTNGGGSLTDEVAEFQQTPEYAQQFPGTAQTGQPLPEAAFNDRFGATIPPEQIAQGRSGVANALQQPSQQMQQPQQAQGQIPAEFAGSQQLQSAMQRPQGSIVQALMEGQPADPAQIAQARAQGANMGQPQQGPLGIDPSILEALNNPFLSDGRKAVLKTMVEQKLAQQEEQRQQQMRQSDPAYQLDLETKRAQLEKLRNPEKEAPKVQTLKLSDGSEMAVQWNSQTQNWDPIQAPSGGGDITPKTKLTEAQSKLTLFQNLQTESQPVLLDLESQFNPANMQDAAARSTPIAGNFFKTEKGQMYEAAATSWAEGALRIATGAAATPEEMERTKKAYFAQPGDTPTTIAFKAQMREMYNRSIEKALGSTNVEGSLPKPSEFVKQFEGAAEKGSRAPTAADDVPEGVDPEDWKFMTPEGRALFQ